jgi:hypothetical protein
MRRRVIVIGAVLLVGLAALAAVVGVSYYRSHRDLSFDRATWIRPVGWCEHSRRGMMVKDLVRRHLRPGMPMKRVRSLIGPPDEVSDYGTAWLYNVDREDEFFLDTCVGLELWTHGHRLQRAFVFRDD